MKLEAVSSVAGRHRLLLLQPHPQALHLVAVSVESSPTNNCGLNLLGRDRRERAPRFQMCSRRRDWHDSAPRASAPRAESFFASGVQLCPIA
jgi:hypothetical protein